MQNKLKVKVSDLSDGDLKRIEEININKAKAIVAAVPFATLTYIALKTKLDMTFLVKHKNKILT